MSIASDLLEIKRIQLACRDAIEAMGVDVGSAPFAEYPALIMRIESELQIVMDGDEQVFDGDELVVVFAARA